MHLTDRETRLTAARIWGLMGWWAKIERLAQILRSVGAFVAIPLMVKVLACGFDVGNRPR
ncbi:MAG: hypothetical protein PVG99_00065 [Desulfobacteraceae bacterium]|jgi:hypothetical protein